MIFGTQGLFPPGLSRPMGLAFMISAEADVIAIEIARFMENMNVSTTEFVLMAQRLLKDDSRLRKVILKWMPS